MLEQPALFYTSNVGYIKVVYKVYFTGSNKALLIFHTNWAIHNYPLQTFTKLYLHTSWAIISFISKPMHGYTSCYISQLLQINTAQLVLYSFIYLVYWASLVIYLAHYTIFHTS